MTETLKKVPHSEMHGWMRDIAYHLTLITWYKTIARRVAKSVVKVTNLDENNPANPAISGAQLVEVPQPRR